MPYAHVNDIDINYLIEGEGPETVVLINGLADDLLTWVYQVDALLAAGYRVLRFDNRGIGESSKPAGPYTTELFAREHQGACRDLAEPIGGVVVAYRVQLSQISGRWLVHVGHGRFELGEFVFTVLEELLGEGPQRHVTHHRRHTHDGRHVRPQGEHA